MDPDHTPQIQHTSGLDVERLDDIPLLIGLQQKLGLDHIIDDVIPRHWLHQGLSIGQLVIGWNAHILSEEDHRKVAVQQWAAKHDSILSELFATPLRPTDFTDDRLGQVLRHLADDTAWSAIESRLWQQSVSVYRLTPERVRLDATRFSGYHTPDEDGLMQRGYNSQTPNQAQVKLMVASIDQDRSGHLVVTDVVSGDKADDPLYLPVIQRMRATLGERGLLYLGDSKMSALGIRAELARGGDFYLVPLAKVGTVPELFKQCIQEVVDGHHEATLIYNQAQELIAAGYETHRAQQAVLASGDVFGWQERLLVVRSLAEARKQQATLQRHLDQATQELLALTPKPGRGRRQMRTQAELNQKAEAILARHGVADYLTYTAAREVSVQTHYIGPGRGSPNRPKRQHRKVRYQITEVTRDESAVAAAFWQMGWQLYATNQPAEQLPLDEAVQLYRAAPRIERHFHLFKSAPIGIQPLYVRDADQIKGLCRLLSLCVRLLTLIELVTRRQLSQQDTTLAGLYEGNPKRQTDKPTAVRLLRAFRGIHRVHSGPADRQRFQTTPLSDLQRQILQLLGLPESLYQAPPVPPNPWRALVGRCAQMWDRFSHTLNHVCCRT